jgi:hypothetical protein
MRQRARIGGVGDAQPGDLGDIADHHLDSILVGLEDMHRGAICGNTGGRNGGGFDVDTGGRDRIHEVPTWAGRELHCGCRCRAGQRQLGPRHCTRP